MKNEHYTLNVEDPWAAVAGRPTTITLSSFRDADHLGFDVEDSKGGKIFVDIPCEQMIELALKILEMAGEEASGVTNIYYGTINYYGHGDCE